MRYNKEAHADSSLRHARNDAQSLTDLGLNRERTLNRYNKPNEKSMSSITRNQLITESSSPGHQYDRRNPAVNTSQTLGNVPLATSSVPVELSSQVRAKNHYQLTNMTNIVKHRSKRLKALPNQNQASLIETQVPSSTKNEKA